MKLSLNTILAIAIASQLAFAPASAFAASKPKEGQNAWLSSSLARQQFNFRFTNGDTLAVRQANFLFKNVTVQLHRSGEKKAGADQSTSLSSILQFAGPSQLFSNPDPRITENYKAVLMSDSPTKINMMFVRGDNGILVIGQINQVAPAQYFTYVIPGAQELPTSQASYFIPNDVGTSADVGIMLGFKGDKSVRLTLSVGIDRSADRPAMAVARQASAEDQKFLKIPYVNGVFNVPAELRSELTASTTYSQMQDASGVSKYRMNMARSTTLLTSLKDKIYGQDTALERIVFHYQKMTATKATKPTVLVMMGPSGVGKTFTAQQVAKEVSNGDETRFLEVAGNEFNEHAGALTHTKLLGSPRGVSGAVEGSLITWMKALDGKPGILLINEGDKMHPDIWMKLMELLDQGKITGGDGKTLYNPNLLIMITTNRGATQMFPGSVSSWSQEDINKRAASFTKNTLQGYYIQQQGLKDEKTLPREVLNRVSDFIPYGPFSKEAAVFVARKAAQKLVQDYQKEYSVTVKFDDDAVKNMALNGWTAADDARQIANQVSNATQNAFDVAVTKLELKDNQTFTVSYDTSDLRKPVYRVTLADGKTATIDGKVVVSANPVRNKELREQLLALEANMKTQVVGQDPTITAVADAVVSHSMRPEKTRPLVIGLLGVSGNGKTETARALASARFGGHLSIISMGEISNYSDFDKKFGSSAQFQGGDISRDFENALKNNPEGGVIVLDEISNMGGGQPESRAALLMKLYGIFEEGTFVSPVDNRTYDLSKYIFVLTGNECEGLFANVSSDDMLKATWQDNRAPEKVNGMLTDAKYPQAFINRAKWFLMKPLLSYEVHTVTEKLWKRDAQAFERENTGVKITTGTNFFDRVSLAYFSPAKGGRAVRDIFEDKIGNLFLRSLVASGIDMDDLRGVEVRFDLVDNRLALPFLTSHSPKRSVGFKATVLKGGKALSETVVDATDLAAEQHLLAKDSALAVSYHEMGHASFEGISPDVLKALGYPGGKISEITGQELQYVTIRGGRVGNLHYYGYARSSPITGAMSNPTHDRVVIQIAQLWAGAMAQQMAGYPADAGWSNDLEKIRKLATNYFTTWGLDQELARIPVGNDGKPVIPPHLQEAFARKYNALLLEGKNLAEKVVRLRWDFIGSASIELMKKGEISIDRIREIDAKVSTTKTLGKRVPVPKRTPVTPVEDNFSGAAHASGLTCEILFR